MDLNKMKKSELIETVKKLDAQCAENYQKYVDACNESLENEDRIVELQKKLAWAIDESAVLKYDFDDLSCSHRNRLGLLLEVLKSIDGLFVDEKLAAAFALKSLIVAMESGYEVVDLFCGRFEPKSIGKMVEYCSEDGGRSAVFNLKIEDHGDKKISVIKYARDMSRKGSYVMSLQRAKSFSEGAIDDDFMGVTSSFADKFINDLKELGCKCVKIRA